MSRLHVIGFPHTQVTAKYSWCAYTQKVRRFCNMMTDLGHDVLLYAGSETDTRVTEHIVVNTRDTDPYKQSFPPTWSADDPFWSDMNDKAANAISTRYEPGDYLCLIAGYAQQNLAIRYPDMVAVEYGVGYEGTFADYRVFESYAWMHTIYGYQQGAMRADGKFFDAVIPNSYDTEEFELGDGSGEYLLYIGRLTPRKGIQIALDTAKAADVPLIVAGDGDFVLPDWVDYQGLVGPKERTELYGSAIATIVPTLYVEPFGGVAVESMLCGTPAITTDFGAFTETVDVMVGTRCRMLRDFVAAVDTSKGFDRSRVRDIALSRYSTDVVKFKYDRYFNQLDTLKDKGWYTLD